MAPWEHCCEGTAGRRYCCPQKPVLSRVCITWRVVVYNTALPVTLTATCAAAEHCGFVLPPHVPVFFYTTTCSANAAPGHSHNFWRAPSFSLGPRPHVLPPPLWYLGFLGGRCSDVSQHFITSFPWCLGSCAECGGRGLGITFLVWLCSFGIHWRHLHGVRGSSRE